MEAAIKNITSFVTVGNLVVNQLMEREVATTVTTKVVFTKEPKWTTVIAKNMRQVVNRAVETLANAPKQEEHKLNLLLTSFKAKEGETKKELVQRLNIELLQGQMRLHAKVVVATRQQSATSQVSTMAASSCPSAVLLKFATSENH
jgi:hypothetical protein